MIDNTIYPPGGTVKTVGESVTLDVSFSDQCALLETEELYNHSLRCHEDFGGNFTRGGKTLTTSPITEWLWF